jgi:hypothetical protein
MDHCHDLGEQGAGGLAQGEAELEARAADLAGVGDDQVAALARASCLAM